MKKNNFSRILPVIIIIMVTLIAIFAIISLGSAIFKPKTKDSTAVDSSRLDLLDTNINRSVRMTIRGPIVADEDFRSYRISVSPTSRSMYVYKGYLNEIVEGVDLSNNTAAYEEFVYALDKANFALGKPLSGSADDVRGICATGTVTEFDIMNADNSEKHLWTSTCSGSKGSLSAYAPQVKNLFLEQIPDSKRLSKVYGRFY